MKTKLTKKEYRVIMRKGGRITIPAEIRRELGLKPGVRVEWHIIDNGFLLIPQLGPRSKVGIVLKLAA